MKKILFIALLFSIKQINAQVCFGPLTNYTVGGLQPRAITIADFNSDGIKDLVAHNFNSGNVSALMGTGTGSFGSATNFTVGVAARSVINTDFNGDGKADLALDGGSSNVNVLLGTGAGSFGVANSFTISNNGPYIVCSADFNGDGFKDLAATNNGFNFVGVILGTGTGSFGAYTNFAVGTAPWGVVSADVNSDGNADLIVANSTSNDVSVLLGTGTGSFGAATNYASGGTNARSIISTDFNGDGKPDIALTNYGSSNVSVLLNTGAGTFGAAVTFAIGSGANSIISADFNLDGKADLATANYSPGNVSVLIGNGAGSFAPATTFTAGTNPIAVGSADFNGDGKADLAVSNYNSNNISIFLNTTPLINISGTTTICNGSNTTLTASGANTYSWSANAGSSNASAVVVNPTSTTVYTVSGNNSGCATTATKTITVNVNSLPTVTANSTANVVCAGTSITLTGGGANTYVWTGGVTNGIAFVPPSSQTYTVTGTDVNGCVNKATKTITVNSLPAVTANANPGTNICLGNSVTLTGGGATTYTWTGGVTNGVAFVPSSTQPYTVTGTDGNGCINSATNTITVNPLPGVTANATATLVCAGTSVTLTGGGANSYAWTGGITNGTPFTASSTQNYTVTGTDGNGCVNTATKTITVNPLPTVAANTTANVICFGTSVTLTGSGATSYAWTGSVTNGIAFSPSTTQTYTVTGTDGNGCTNTDATTISVNPLPTVTASTTSTLVCLGTLVTLTGGGAVTYTWTGSVANGVAFSPSATQTYTVTGTDGNGCTNSASATINVAVPSTPSICMVTTDSASLNNEIYWDKTLDLDADSFIIYREVSSGSYNRIGSVSKNALSMFTDVNRTVGPANGDPNITTYRYKISVLDSCGNEGPQSPYHTSVYFNDLLNGSFTWNTYSVESTTLTPVTTFELLRDSNNTGFWKVIGTAAGTANVLNDPQYLTFQFIANWRVQANGFNCVPTMRLGNNQNQTTIIRAKSNITNNRTSGINKLMRI